MSEVAKAAATVLFLAVDPKATTAPPTLYSSQELIARDGAALPRSAYDEAHDKARPQP